MSRLAKQVTRVGRDGFQLAQAIFKDSTTKRAVSFKPVLLDQARQYNMVARSLLNVDRQIGLVRYYGIMGYFQQQWQARFSSSLPPSTTSQGSSQKQPNKARIAFMITGSMKQELTEQLGYEDEGIRKMTPLQASLILHHRITADEMEDKLPSIEEEYEKQRDSLKQQQEAEEREKYMAAQREEMKKAEALRQAKFASAIEAKKEASAAERNKEGSAVENKTEVDDQQATSTGPPSHPAPLSYERLSAEAAEFQSSNTLLSASESGTSNGFGNSWFEVNEINPKTGASDRVGLYLDEEEAVLGMKTRQEIAERRESDLTYELKSVEKSDLFSS